jgi:putative ABC transport system permease protein
VLPIQVFTNNCRASLDVIVFYGVPAKRLPRFRNFRFVQGSWDEFAGNQDAAIVGAAVAQRRGLSPGQSFSIADTTVKVAAIYTCPNKSEENYIYTHLKFLQLQGDDKTGPAVKEQDQIGEGTVTQFEIQLDEGADPEAVCAAIDETFRGAPLATDTRPKGVFQSAALADLFELITLAHFIGYACVGLMVVLVATTSLMSVQDRIKEHAVLQTIGFSPWQIFGLVMAESLLVSVAGGLIGASAALLVLTVSPWSIAAEAVAVSLEPSLLLAASGLIVALVIGLVAGFFPAWQAARAEIVPALRHV